MFVPTIFALKGFISDDLFFTCVKVAHHLFSSIPFCQWGSMSLIISLLFAPDNQPKVTEAIKTVLKDDYNYDSTVRIFLLHFASGPCLTDLKSLEHLPSTLSHLYAMLLYWRRRRYSVLQEQEWSGNARVGSGCIVRRKLKKEIVNWLLPRISSARYLWTVGRTKCIITCLTSNRCANCTARYRNSRFHHWYQI